MRKSMNTLVHYISAGKIAYGKTAPRQLGDEMLSVGWIARGKMKYSW